MTHFSQPLLAWFDKHGRTDLPWQQNPTPYRVWISEIMLQQTQVNTVIPYYLRFMQRFPTIQNLAIATLDEVLQQWTGLGYYARARHLHKAAQQICTEYAGELPTTVEKLLALPGIGRSTAGAILALAYQQRHPILDGNVKRVLCRYHALDGPPSDAEINRELWRLADEYTPIQRVAAYTQAIMDLGATICTRSRPNCGLCPFNQSCMAHQFHQETFYPRAKPAKTLPVKTTVFLMIQNHQQEVLLERRPPHGIWGGLWSFPQCLTPNDISHWCQQHLQIVPNYQLWPLLRHTFTHFHLDITPAYIPITTCQPIISVNIMWYNPTKAVACGLAAPVLRLVKQLCQLQEDLLL